MEFENNSANPQSEISDAQRLAATTRKLAVSPLHSDIAPEALPSGTAADTFGSAVPAATIESESEDTSAYQNKATVAFSSPKTRPNALVVTLIVVAVIVAGTVVYLLLQ